MTEKVNFEAMLGPRKRKEQPLLPAPAEPVAPALPELVAEISPKPRISRKALVRVCLINALSIIASLGWGAMNLGVRSSETSFLWTAAWVVGSVVLFLFQMFLSEEFTAETCDKREFPNLLRALMINFARLGIAATIGQAILIMGYRIMFPGA